MSQYYNPKRVKNLFDPKSGEPFKISRSKIELFLECSRCFYLDRRLGIGRPPGYPFNLNTAVDTLLKREFDVYRAKGSKHPLQKTYGISARPWAHEKLDEWRDNFKGVSHKHDGTNLIITGAPDDIWVNDAGDLHVVDYKATSKDGEVGIDADWQIAYKRQVEVYQWLLRQNGFKVSDTAYFVYCNGRTDGKAFDGRLEFDIAVIPYRGDDSWVSGSIEDLHQCLISKNTPKSGADCDFCRYCEAVKQSI